MLGQLLYYRADSPASGGGFILDSGAPVRTKAPPATIYMLNSHRGVVPVIVMRSPSPAAHIDAKPREYPDHMYVDVPTIIKTVSGAVLLVCLLSVAIYILTGFAAVQSLFSLMGILFGSGFYLMGRMLERQYRQSR